MRRAAIGVAACLIATSAMSDTDPCKPGARLTYPISEVIAKEGMSLKIVPMIKAPGQIDPFSDAGGKRTRELILEELSNVGAIERDVKLLALLHWETVNSIPLAGVTAMQSSVFFDDFRTALAAHDGSAEVDLMDRAKSIFEPWGDSARSRYDRFADANPISKKKIYEPLRAVSDDWTRLADPLAVAARAALKDAAYFETLEAARASASDDDRLRYLEAELTRCTSRWWTPDEADAVFGKIPEPQRDLLILSTFMAESMNGSVHQFFYNSSGTLAPQLAEILERLGLPEHAAGIRQGMAKYPAPYPRDTEQRRAIMGGFSEADDNDLYELTIWADDGAIDDAMIARAKETGLWPD